MRFPLPAAVPRLGRDMWLITVALMVFGAAFMGIIQLLRVIYLLRLGAGLELIGVLYGAGSLLFGVLGLPSGLLGQRLGARRALVIGAVVLVFGMALMPLTEVLPGSLRWTWPVIVELVNTVGWSLMVVNSVPILVATTPPEDLKGAYALREALMGVANLVGMLLAGVLPATFAFLTGTTTETAIPYRYGLLVAPVLGALGLVLLFRMGSLAFERRSSSGADGRPIADRPIADRPNADRISWRPLALLLACGFLNQGAVASCRVFTFAYMDTAFGLPTSAIGLISGIGLALAAFAALSSTRLARRVGSAHVMTLASLALVLDLALMAAVRHWLAAAAGTVGVLALFSLWMPAYQTLQMEFARPGQRGMVAGAGFMAMGFGFSLVSMVGGLVAATTGYTALFGMGALLALGSAGLMLYAHRLDDQRSKPLN